MDYNDDDADSPPNPYTISRRKEKVENARYNHIIGNSHVEYDINDDSEEAINIEDDDDDDDGGNGVQRISKYDYEDGVDEDDDDYGDLPKHPKKRKLKTLLASYEFAPRVPPPSKPSQGPGGRNPLTDWTEHGTFILLDAWGDRFVKQGKKSLRSEEWQEVAEKVSQESKMERTDTQCRNRLDTLKKKYKKEKMRFGESSGSLSEWVYFKKMDMLLSSSLPQKTGLSCGVDSGEYVFTNPKVYLNCSNVLDEMRDSPENSGNESEGLPPKKILPPKKTKNVKVRRNGDSIKLLADSIKKFSSVYEKTEKNMRHDLVELEKLRMELHRDLELQKIQILERAQAEIIKIRRGIVKDNNVPADE